MVHFISQLEIQSAIEKATLYFSAILAPKTVGYYTGVWKKLLDYAEQSPDKSQVDIKAFYELVTNVSAYTRPHSSWLKTQARAIFVLLDIYEGNVPKREYYYNRNLYGGIFSNELNRYLDSRIEDGKKSETIRSETILLGQFLAAMEKQGVVCLSQLTADDLLRYLKCLNPSFSDQWKRSHAYTIRKFLTSPALGLAFPYDLNTILLGFRHCEQQRLGSYYTPEEIKAVMNAVERDTPWGKTIYAMMLLACVYGLRVSDIRGLQLSSIHWKEKIISLYQIKTNRFVEIPMTDAVTLALLDYIKNVRPQSDDCHVFLRHTRPYAPYSAKDNFGSKVAFYFKKVGVNTEGKHHGLHSMRHSLATSLISENSAVHEIASILGHANVKSTKLYIWSDIKHLKMCALEVDDYGNR